MKLVLTVALLMSLLTGAFAQDVNETVPTLEQCRAYLSMWPTLKDGKVLDSTSALSVKTIQHRIAVLTSCQVVVNNQHGQPTAEDNWEAVTFRIAKYDYVTLVEKRLASYLERHGESKQFLEEDEAGKR